MKMVNIAHTPEEAAEHGMPVPAEKGNPTYPYGSRLNMDEGMLKKLGIDSAEVGAKVKLHAHGHIVAAHGDEKGLKGVDIQMTHMGMAPRPEADRAIYPAADGEE